MHATNPRIFLAEEIANRKERHDNCQKSSAVTKRQRYSSIPTKTEDRESNINYLAFRSVGCERTPCERI